METIQSVKKNILTAICLALLSSFCAFAEESEVHVIVERTDIGEIDPAPVESAAMQPGLSVIYYKKYSPRNLKNLPETESAKYLSFQGEPIIQLNHQFGKGDVFGSGTNRLVGMRMRGYLNLTKADIYEFQALSNDGVSVIISGKPLINDPTQHSDRLSNIGVVTVKTPGWYPVIIEYFQRKGTAALVLYWKSPGSKEFEPIPQEIYGHIP